MDPRSAIALWMHAVPIARASAAGVGAVKKVQTCAPLPDWEISRAQDHRRT
ncbi:MAG: hypothetical protein U1C73_01490 [Dietzia sp.]|nr:hypothetical protein [Dietzia sp.]